MPKKRSLLGPVLALLSLGIFTAAAFADERTIPAHNAARLSANPPPRPPVGDAEEKARRLFEAVKRDDPSSVADFFLPRGAFALIKAIANPDRRYDVLFRAYVEDVHELHASQRDIARGTFARFELARRGGWTPIGEEGNRLPYYASRHSWLHYTVDGRPRSFEVRVMITWDDHWYITHLNEFH